MGVFRVSHENRVYKFWDDSDAADRRFSSTTPFIPFGCSFSAGFHSWNVWIVSVDVTFFTSSIQHNFLIFAYTNSFIHQFSKSQSFSVNARPTEQITKQIARTHFCHAFLICKCLLWQWMMPSCLPRWHVHRLKRQFSIWCANHFSCRHLCLKYRSNIIIISCPNRKVWIGSVCFRAPQHLTYRYIQTADSERISNVCLNYKFRSKL